MVRATFLFPMISYSYCSSAFAYTKLLNSSSFEQQSFYSKQSSSKHTKQTINTTKNNTPKQKEGLEEHMGG